MEKEYVPYVVNKSLSYFTDTLLYANEINKYGFLDNKMQYEYLLHSVRQGKRFSKWAKKDSSAVIDCISKYYQVNHKRAEEYASVLTESQKEEIVEKVQSL
jgi:sulfur transfer protein SufE